MTISDDCELVLKSLTRLEVLELSCFRCKLFGKQNSDTLRNISDCTSLKKLNLSQVQIGDIREQFESLTKLSQLSELYLNMTNITSKELSILAKLPQLKKLHMIGCENISNIEIVSHIPSVLHIAKISLVYIVSIWLNNSNLLGRISGSKIFFAS
jgi:Leucine-rich repeat (LRR) protein